ncbi:Crp/Fnr family transcriptional regulator [Desulfatibacillum aliphaticivorans]|uniref:Crp/Fnr family transcriptional regulator n=1 Tax=Desulfatibacillum aliphaticivorans TaxID=218208 RepID=UPI000481F7A5|nr:Crp/Fnr family transcriptional regulator [Desulfatibacillum aliphaticivorans]
MGLDKSLDKVFEIISHIPFFAGLDEDQLKLVRNMAAEVSFKKGQFIFYDGDQAEGFYAALDGQVKIYKISPEGKEQIFHVFGPGEPFGEVPVFSGDSYPANAQALIKTRCLYFSRKGIVELINQSPAIAMNMLAVLARRLREFTVQVENLSLKEVDGRVAGYILHMATEQNSPDLVVLHISKAHLASLLGTIPETLSRSLGRLKDRGLIQVDKREIQIIDRQGLEDCSTGGNGDMDD